MITATMGDDPGAFRDRGQRPGEFPTTPFGRTYLPTPPADEFRARFNQSSGAGDPRMNGFRLPQPLPNMPPDRRMSAGFIQDPYAPLPMGPPEGYHDLRRGSLNQQLVMVPTYVPMYGSPDQWPGVMPQQGGQWPHPGMPMPMPGYGLVQRPLPPAPMGPVEKPKKRRAPPSPQYLHMTVQEMIEELAYRKVDTSQLQARKAKKAEYIEQLQRADRNGNRGRGAWKSCHGNVPPLAESKD